MTYITLADCTFNDKPYQCYILSDEPVLSAEQANDKQYGYIRFSKLSADEVGDVILRDIAEHPYNTGESRTGIVTRAERKNKWSTLYSGTCTGGAVITRIVPIKYKEDPKPNFFRM